MQHMLNGNKKKVFLNGDRYVKLCSLQALPWSKPRSRVVFSAASTLRKCKIKKLLNYLTWCNSLMPGNK